MHPCPDSNRTWGGKDAPGSDPVTREDASPAGHRTWARPDLQQTGPVSGSGLP